MKKYLALILVVGVLIFISPFKVFAGEAKEDWKNDLDLSDSISTSVVKLDDGVVVMQYEGGASDNNVLKKFDFDGKEIWSIKNNYGYHIASLEDSFLVYTTGKDYSITKISSQGKLVWTKEYNSEGSYSVSDWSSFSSSQVIKIDSGFIIFSDNCIGLYDDNGTFIKYITFSDIYYSVFDKEVRDNISDFSVALSSDGESVLVSFLTREFVTPRYGYYYVVARYSLDLNYQESVRYYTPTAYYPLFKMIETENNYILTGMYTLVLDKKGEIKRVLNVPMIDFEYIDGDVYAYVGKSEEDYGIYSTYVVKYDENLQKIDEYKLPFAFSSTSSNEINTTGFIQMKNRSVFYKNGDDVYSIVLNSPMSNVSTGYVRPINNLDYTLSSKYNISQYKLANGSTGSEIVDDGIIDNIFENPETSSIVVVIAFVIVILLGGIGFYFGYRKKKVKNM